MGCGESQKPKKLGWWSISGEAIMEMLRRCHVGEDPDLVYAELYANSDHEYLEEKDD